MVEIEGLTFANNELKHRNIVLEDIVAQTENEIRKLQLQLKIAKDLAIKRKMEKTKLTGKLVYLPNEKHEHNGIEVEQCNQTVTHINTGCTKGLYVNQVTKIKDTKT